MRAGKRVEVRKLFIAKKGFDDAFFQKRRSDFRPEFLSRNSAERAKSLSKLHRKASQVANYLDKLSENISRGIDISIEKIETGTHQPSQDNLESLRSKLASIIGNARNLYTQLVFETHRIYSEDYILAHIGFSKGHMAQTQFDLDYHKAVHGIIALNTYCRTLDIHQPRV